MRSFALLVIVSSSACLPMRPASRTPQPPVCVRGGPASVEQSLEDYGSTYTPGLNGPAPAAPDSWLVARSQAGAECIPPPWWQPEQIP